MVKGGESIKYEASMFIKFDSKIKRLRKERIKKLKALNNDTNI